MTNNDIHGLAHIGLTVPSISMAEAFYTQLLGFVNIYSYRYNGQIPVAFLKNGNCVIELVEDPQASPADGVVNHIAFAVEDIEAVKARLEQANVPFEDTQITHCPDCFPNGTKWILFRGVCGERLEITQAL